MPLFEHGFTGACWITRTLISIYGPWTDRSKCCGGIYLWLIRRPWRRPGRQHIIWLCQKRAGERASNPNNQAKLVNREHSLSQSMKSMNTKNTNQQCGQGGFFTNAVLAPNSSSRRPPGAFYGTVQMSSALRTWLRQGEPNSKHRSERLIWALLPAMLQRVANPDRPYGFGGPLRFVVRVDEECLPVVATVLPENENVMHLAIDSGHPNDPAEIPMSPLNTPHTTLA